MDILTDAEALSAIAATIGASIAAGVAAYKRIKKERFKASCFESELELQKEALSYGPFSQESQEIIYDLSKLFEETCIDRFLLLRAWNGEFTPQYTNSIFQYRLGAQEPVQYQHFELDNDYVERLNTICGGGRMVFDVESIPDSKIKRVYKMEQVKHSAWFFVSKIQSRSNPKKFLISYCSFATHENAQIDNETLTRCELIVGKLKAYEKDSFN